MSKKKIPEAVKNTIPERSTEPTINIKIDEKDQKAVKQMTQKEGKEIIAKYKEKCEKFPVRMLKYKRKKEALKTWLESLPK